MGPSRNLKTVIDLFLFFFSATEREIIIASPRDEISSVILDREFSFSNVFLQCKHY